MQYLLLPTPMVSPKNVLDLFDCNPGSGRVAVARCMSSLILLRADKL